ncbi:hypothetical protein DL89DRAFT_147878 [Linderina pennispora]|uniref:Uncharacterized protein n=1 Tax=Linderina pennispora TaxID=61395 RepID=A0A1Y1VV97_9FUNG|nr:uncharacterized protein DL89DRAFT_147878 [Linderina pennispora]ORX64935.1 hypothetical protein DL89DRAFT_147878 [Linderina pennispora]
MAWTPFQYQRSLCIEYKGCPIDDLLSKVNMDAVQKLALAGFVISCLYSLFCGRYEQEAHLPHLLELRIERADWDDVVVAPENT